MTKIKHFSTGKASLCIVELPEGATNCVIIGNDRTWFSPKLKWMQPNGKENFQYLTEANWSILSPVKDITEEQAATIVDEQDDENEVKYAHYLTKPLFAKPGCVTPLESFASLLQSIPIYTENPHGEKPDQVLYSEELCKYCPLEKKGVYGVDGGYVAGCEGSKCEEAFENFKEQWTEAEQNVFRNSILLVNNETK